MPTGSLLPERTVPGTTVTSRATFRLAAVALIVAGLVWARPLLVPVVLALMLAILSHPVVSFFERRRVPYGAAVALGQLITTVPLVGIVTLFLVSAQPFVNTFDRYQASLEVHLAASLEWVVSHLAEGERRVALEASLRSEVIPRALEFGGEVVKGFAQSVGAMLSAAALTLIIAFFALLEVARLRFPASRMVAAFGALYARLARRSR